MPLFTTLSALSTIADNNPPDGVVDAPSTIDNQLRLLGSFIAQLRDAPMSFRNKVRNPKMDIAQRGASFAAVASGAYTLDGWTWQSNGGQVVTISQQADVMAGSECQNSLRVTVTTANAAIAAGNFAMIEQPIEGYLVRDLQGNPIAIQFPVRSPKTGTHCVVLRNSGSDRSYVLTYSVTTANTWQLVTLLLPGGLVTAGTWNWTTGTGVRLGFVLACGSTYQTTAGAWQAGNFLATAAQVNCLDTVGNIFAITGVQLEKGGASTPLEHRDPALELLLNQRYYEIVYGHNYLYQTAGNIISAVGAVKVPKRAPASLGTVSVSAPETNFTYTTSVIDSFGNVVFYGTATASGSVEIQRNAPLIAEL